MDLGTIITGLGSQYIQSRYANNAVQVQPALDFGVPFVDVIPESGAACGTKGMVWNPNANCGQGKWQRKTKRRRKRLATKSDLADLSSLKGILGTGEAFKVWIATHSH